MANVAVAHPNLMSKGGAEAVAVNVIQSLCKEHNVNVLTISSFNKAELESHYDIDISDANIKKVYSSQSKIRKSIENLNNSALLPYNLHALEHAILNRKIQKKEYRYDLLVSTHGEFYSQSPCIQYIHFPNYYRNNISSKIISQNEIETAYRTMCRSISNFTKEDLKKHKVVTNSEWSKDILEDLYGISSRVVYPPVDDRNFYHIPWEQKDTDFVTISRITPDKNIHNCIKIISQVRDRGHDVDLHIVGSVSNKPYYKKVKRLSKRLEFVHIHENVSRDQLIKIACKKKFGIHGKKYEHFGIAIAELVLGGAIPFVPDTGGQQEIVKDQRLMYSQSQDAVEKIDLVLSSNQIQKRIKAQLNQSQNAYSRSTFQEKIRSITNSMIDK